jgi:trans-2,3-dihydro-3-hydroxyanthranilate isomerase
MKLPFYWVDAFTEQKFSGNPCAVVHSADQLSAKAMLQVAKELNLSETAFVSRSTRADFAARYFTPAEEIPMAGHPTLATIRSLIESKAIDPEIQTEVTLELPAGIIPISIKKTSLDYMIIMQQLKPQFLSTHDAEEIASLFGLKFSDLISGIPIQTVSTGTPQLMIPVQGLESLKNLSMNVEAYADYKKRSDFFSPHIFCLQGITSQASTFARHLGLAPDTLEDPFTGSATGAMAAYLWHYGLIEKSRFVAEQGHWMGRPGSAQVEILGPPHNIDSVKVGGSAVVVLKGMIEI